MENICTYLFTFMRALMGIYLIANKAHIFYWITKLERYLWMINEKYVLLNTELGRKARIYWIKVIFHLPNHE